MNLLFIYKLYAILGERWERLLADQSITINLRTINTSDIDTAIEILSKQLQTSIERSVYNLKFKNKPNLPDHFIKEIQEKNKFRRVWQAT